MWMDVRTKGTRTEYSGGRNAVYLKPYTHVGSTVPIGARSAGTLSDLSPLARTGLSGLEERPHRRGRPIGSQVEMLSIFTPRLTIPCTFTETSPGHQANRPQNIGLCAYGTRWSALAQCPW